MRSIKQIYKAVKADISDLKTHRALPLREMEQLDPFIFLNHHGPQKYSPDNFGMPFGPHPHRGFETLTVIIDGDVKHKDSSGGVSVIHEGGIQWMTAGSGLIHSETSSDEFKANGGQLEILQLWMNLPAKMKMIKPTYQGFEKSKVPSYTKDGVTVEAYSGKWDDEVQGPAKSVTDLKIGLVRLDKGASYKFPVPADHKILFYVIRGNVNTGNADVPAMHTVEFNAESGDVEFTANEDSIVFLGHGAPLNDPIVAYGPFVMNTEDEIRQAYSDMQSGKLGRMRL